MKSFYCFAVVLSLSLMVTSESLAQNFSPWMNVYQRLDVNADGGIGPLDALLIGNAIDVYGSGVNLAAAGVPLGEYLDTNGNGYLEEADWDMVMAYLNNGSGLAYNSNLTFDINGDGNITQSDWDIVLWIFVNIGSFNVDSSFPFDVDVNLDGMFDVQDLVDTYYGT